MAWRNTPRRRKKVHRYISRLAAEIAKAHAPAQIVIDLAVDGKAVALTEVFMHCHGVKGVK